jgi:hypothetical protein
LQQSVSGIADMIALDMHVKGPAQFIMIGYQEC